MSHSTSLYISLIDILDRADKELFRAEQSDHAHVLAPLLPAAKTYIGRYNLRDRAHNRQQPISSTAGARNFIYRMLFVRDYSSIT